MLMLLSSAQLYAHTLSSIRHKFYDFDLTALLEFIHTCYICTEIYEVIVLLECIVILYDMQI